MSKVIVFGGSGFLGSHVADALTAAGHEVVIYDMKISEHLQAAQQMVVGDILDVQKVAEAVKKADIVYNFAGIADIAEASRRPFESVQYNILGTSIILEACRKEKVKRFVFASSLYVYSKSGSFYRTTKQACEQLIEDYYEVYGMPYTILRFGSLYGPRADQNNFIHQVVLQALSEKKIQRAGDGEEIREYVHVTDAAQSSVDILTDEFKNQRVVITGDRQIKIKDFLVMVNEMLQGKVHIEYVPSDSPSHYEITPYTFAPRLARKLVRKTSVDLGEGVLNCIQDAYKQMADKDPGAFSDKA